MILEHLGYIELPPHLGKGGFDHASYHLADDRLYVAHTANDAVDVIDCAADRYLYSISGLTGVAGVLTSQERDLVFTSNRAENTMASSHRTATSIWRRCRWGTAPTGSPTIPRAMFCWLRTSATRLCRVQRLLQSSMSKRDR